MSRNTVKSLSLWLAALACLLSSPADADQITYQMVTVGNSGNDTDTVTGYGRVDYSYQIGKYDVTIGQYTDFLNAVAKTDTYSLYNGNMATNLNVAGISRTGLDGSYTYSVISNGGNSANRPITYVNWFDSARFANWMANGQPTGAQSSTTTENGAYNVNGATTWQDGAPTKNATNPNTSAAPTFYIPTENEWYKAAYYDPTLNGGTGGYYAFATQNNSPPGNTIGSTANMANYNNGVYSVTQSSSNDPNQNYLTDVGAFTGSGSFYSTFDQNGNVFQWNDKDGSPSPVRGIRGGGWNSGSADLERRFPSTISIDAELDNVGFRLASPVGGSSSVPEIDPNSLGSVLALVLGSLGLLERRRLKAA